MKKLILITIYLFVSLMLFAQDGVNFRNLTYEEALAAAKAEKKMIFVDCYTSWCGPCKQMTNVVFPQKEAGDYFNPRFVCLKYDMDKEEGQEMKKIWKIKAYPTFLIIRSDGEIQHAIVGGGELKHFIEKVERGLKEKTSLVYLENRYKQGKISKKELLAYEVALQESYQRDEAGKIRKELFEKLSEKDKVKAEYWSLFSGISVKSEEFDFVVANLAEFQKNIGREKVDRFLQDSYTRAFFTETLDASEMKKIKEQLNHLDTDSQSALMFSFRIVETTINKNIGELLELSETHSASLSKTDHWLLIDAFAKLQNKATKEELKRMSALAAQVAPTHEGRLKEEWEVLAEKYKSMSHVGGYFEELTLEQALAKAKRMRRKVLVDCYTSWCGPCKIMTKEVFPQENVGDFMNSRFVNVKYDMEKGEGKEIDKKYGVKAYPTFLVLNADGTIYHKIVGAYLAEEWMKVLGEGLHPDNTYGNLKKQYQEGNREKLFLTKYLKTLINVYESDRKVAEELLTTLSDEEKMSPDYWFVFENSRLTPSNSDQMKYLIDNREQFRKNIGAEQVNKRLFEDYKKRISPIMQGVVDASKAKELQSIEKEVELLGLGNEREVVMNLRIAKAILTKNQNQILTACEKECDQLALEKFLYLNLFRRYEKTATSAQKNRWIKLGKELIPKVQDQYYKQQLEKFINQK